MSTERHPAPPPRSSLRRASVCFVASGVFHLALAVCLALVASDRFTPRVEIVWLNLDNRLGAAAPPQRPRPQRPQRPAEPPQPKPKATTPPARDTGDEPAAPRRPRRRASAGRFKPSRVRLARLVPGDAALVLLIRCDRVRRSPYARAVRRLLEVFYDHRTLLASSGVDPLRDFDALMIATPNPYRVTRTFLAARHRLGATRVRRALARATRLGGGTISWGRGPLGEVGKISSPPQLKHDPRVVVIRPGLLLLTEPTLARKLLAAPAASGAKRRPLVDRLTGIDRQGGRGRRAPGLLLQVVNIHRLVRMPRGLVPPRNIQITVPARAPADVRGVLTFADGARAASFVKRGKAKLAWARSSLVTRAKLALLGLGPLLGIKLSRKGSRVRIAIHLNGRQVNEILDLFRAMIPPVYVPGRPARRRDAAAPDGSHRDAGAGRATRRRDGAAADGSRRDAAAAPREPSPAGPARGPVDGGPPSRAAPRR